MMEPSPASGRQWRDRLGAYFESGWAFLIPYLAAYLLYAGLKWPVNPVSQADAVAPTLFRPPCLLHCFWGLHVLHLLLGAVALGSWWQNLRHRPASARPPDSVAWFQRALPWVCVALLFYIPGVYLEFPCDTWQHYDRVNEWSWLQVVTDHSFWQKSSYFLAYSLVGQITPPIVQLRAFDVFYTGCCLLLCWQYYRLARVLALGPRAAMSFVLVQALLFGNGTFGFYRYYGMSSTVVAQLGAVALVRVAISALGAPAGGSPAASGWKRILLWILKLSPVCLLLLAVTAFNHLQGLGLAFLGVAAVIFWRLIQWRRAAAWWLGGAAVLLSVIAVRWAPRHPALDAMYRPAGWLNDWYGFNIFDFSSMAGSRAVSIIGLFGLVNLVAGLLLLRRNHVAGWLTVLPVAALCLPCFALPYASLLAAQPYFPQNGDIVVFHRMLLAIPCGLALVTLVAGWKALAPEGAGGTRLAPNTSPGLPHRSVFRPLSAANRAVANPFAWLLVCLSALLVVPASSRYYNRLFNILMVPPDDLAMRHVIRSSTAAALTLKPRLANLVERPEPAYLEYGGLLTTTDIGYVLNASGAALITGPTRPVSLPKGTVPSYAITAAMENLAHAKAGHVRDVPFPALTNLYSPPSQTAYLSNTWLPDKVALEHAGQSELFAPRSVATAIPRAPQLWLEWSGSKRGQWLPGEGAGVALIAGGPEERGRLDSVVGDQPIRVGDAISFRSYLRTPDGNGWRVEVRIHGPEFARQLAFTGHPSPLGHETWTIGHFQIRPKQPGQYTVELAGNVFWPSQTYLVRYRFSVQPPAR